jgi:hypothetical protein
LTEGSSHVLHRSNYFGHCFRPSAQPSGGFTGRISAGQLSIAPQPRYLHDERSLPVSRQLFNRRRVQSSRKKNSWSATKRFEEELGLTHLQSQKGLKRERFRVCAIQYDQKI